VYIATELTGKARLFLKIALLVYRLFYLVVKIKSFTAMLTVPDYGSRCDEMGEKLPV
jgi:hypothetical protein